MTTGNPIFRGCPSNKHSGTCAKLYVYDWLSDIPNTANPEEIVEIRFKNTRKDYYRNVNGLKLELGELVAVEASPGHDIGMVSLTGDLVLKQMKRHKVTMLNGEMRKIYRKAKPVDIEKWEQAMQREHETMIKSRHITTDLGLNMKIGDVEFQGDGTKAIFYYIADDRVDFRTLIKVLADSFRIRIEMKQIGARQEAGRIGGLGPCGRELCCCSWMSSFSSVTTTAARYQDISLNPQKLAGQCSKLKCCLNYEVDAYIDEQRDFPPTNIRLETEDGYYNYLKSDIFKRIYWYTHEGHAPGGMLSVAVERVKEVIGMNRHGKKPIKLVEVDANDPNTALRSVEYDDILGQDSLTRFDKPKGDRTSKRRKPANKSRSGRAEGEREAQPIRAAGDAPLKPVLNKDINTEERQAQREGGESRGDNRNDNQNRRNDKPRGQNPSNSPQDQGERVQPERTERLKVEKLNKDRKPVDQQPKDEKPQEDQVSNDRESEPNNRSQQNKNRTNNRRDNRNVKPRPNNNQEPEQKSTDNEA